MEKITFEYPAIEIAFTEFELETDGVMNTSGPLDNEEIRIGNR